MASDCCNLKMNAFFAANKSGKSAESYVRGWSPKLSNDPYVVEYAADLTVPQDFGEPGAILVTNLHDRELFLMEIVVHGFNKGPVFFSANTWIHSRKHNSESRIIFKNQVIIARPPLFLNSLIRMRLHLSSVFGYVDRLISRPKRQLALRIFVVRTCRSYVATGEERGSCTRECTIMMCIMTWAILIKVKS